MTNILKNYKTAMLYSLACILAAAPTFAQQTSIDNGVAYLGTTQNLDGSWGNNSGLTVLDTSTVLDTLKDINASSSAYSNGAAWLNAQSPLSTDFISRKVLTLHRAGVDVSADLSTLINSRNLDGGWGGDSNFTSMVLDTTLSLLALKAANATDQTVLNNALTYLLSNQNADGGFGFYVGDSSNVYMTALVSWTFQQFPQTTAIATAINKATSFLIARQNTDGGFGSSPSTVFETAHAYIALVSVITDATVLENAITYLTVSQSADGATISVETGSASQWCVPT